MFLDTFEEEINTPATLSKSQTSEHKSPTNEGIYGDNFNNLSRNNYFQSVVQCCFNEISSNFSLESLFLISSDSLDYNERIRVSSLYEITVGTTG